MELLLDDALHGFNTTGRNRTDKHSQPERQRHTDIETADQMHTQAERQTTRQEVIEKAGKQPDKGSKDSQIGLGGHRPIRYGCKETQRYM